MYIAQSRLATFHLGFAALGQILRLCVVSSIYILSGGHSIIVISIIPTHTDLDKTWLSVEILPIVNFSFIVMLYGFRLRARTFDQIWFYLSTITMNTNLI